MQVGDATTVRYANEEAMAVENPMNRGSPPMFNTIGPNTATVAALLSKLVRIPASNTAVNHRRVEISSLTIFIRLIADSATHNALPVACICTPKEIAAPNKRITPQFVFRFKSSH